MLLIIIILGCKPTQKIFSCRWKVLGFLGLGDTA